MTQEKTYAKAARAALLDELVAATGRDPRVFDVGTDDAATTVRFPDDLDPAAVDAVVAAHDAAAIDAADAQRASEDVADRDLARSMYAVLLADAARLEDSTQALTAQVIRNHLARTDKALAAILRRLARTGVL